jgi:hypothetical protein
VHAGLTKNSSRLKQSGHARRGIETMEENNPHRSLSRRQEKKLLKAADLAARTEFACPERIGCPDAQTLNRLARRDSGLDPTPDLRRRNVLGLRWDQVDSNGESSASRAAPKAVARTTCR